MKRGQAGTPTLQLLITASQAVQLQKQQLEPSRDHTGLDGGRQARPRQLAGRRNCVRPQSLCPSFGGVQEGAPIRTG